MQLSKIVSAVGDESLANRADSIREQLNSALGLGDEIAQRPLVKLTDQTVTEFEIREILRQRRNRDRFFDAELFADPAWDILLELYAAELGQLRISVGSVCNGSSVPPTTALRWINLLERKGLIQRRADPRDARRVFLSLSSSALQAMESYFRTVPKASRPI